MLVTRGLGGRRFVAGGPTTVIVSNAIEADIAQMITADLLIDRLTASIAEPLAADVQSDRLTGDTEDLDANVQ